MKSSDLHIRRWVATVVLVAALVGGGVLAIGLRNWSGHEVFGAPSARMSAGARTHSCASRQLLATVLRRF